MTKRMTESNYTKLVIEKTRDNHIWLNKMHYPFASDEQKIKLANMILDSLKHQINTDPGARDNRRVRRNARTRRTDTDVRPYRSIGV